MFSEKHLSNISVAIAGAGLSGLCLAQALVQMGFDVQIYERDDSLDARRQGYRITVDQHGAAALKQCLPSHLFDLVVATASVPEDVGYFRFTNQNLAEIFKLTFKRDPHMSQQQILGQVDRSTLRTILLSGLQDRVHFGKAAVRVETTKEGATLHFADGTAAHASIVVGADGVHSPLRGQLLPDCPIIDTGYRGIYGKTPLIQQGRSVLPKAFENSGVFALGRSPGRGFFFTTMRFNESPQSAFTRFREVSPPSPSEDYIMWALVFPKEDLPSDLWTLNANALHQLTLNVALDFHPVLQRFVEQATINDTIVVALNAATRPQNWSASRATLMGDAIHVMPPLGAHGGNTALRDAALLAETLQDAVRQGQPLDQALKTYQEKMVVDAFKEVDSATAMLHQMTTKNAFVRWAMLRAVPWIRSLVGKPLNLEAH